jgi:hypothetical protein
MKNDKEMGDRFARVIDRISRGEFKLLALRAESGDLNIVEVHMKLRRTPTFDTSDGALKLSKFRRRPPAVIRQLIFDDE